MGCAYTASIALPVASWLASFAAAVLAFIGGLQQAAAVQSGSASATPLVVLGIGAALVGWAAVASAQWRGGATSDELLTLCAAYSLQACVERAWKLPTSAAGVLMSDVRLPPMVVAAASLAAAAAWRAPAGVVPLERALAAALAPLGLAFVAASVRRATRPRTKFSVVGVGTTNKCKVAAVRQVLATTPAIARSLVACKVSTGVDEQPVGLDVTIAGAKNRAAAARALVRRSAPKRRRGTPPSLGLGMELASSRSAANGSTSAWRRPSTARSTTSASRAPSRCRPPSRARSSRRPGWTSRRRATTPVCRATRSWASTAG